MARNHGVKQSKNARGENVTAFRRKVVLDLDKLRTGLAFVLGKSEEEIGAMTWGDVLEVLETIDAEEVQVVTAQLIAQLEGLLQGRVERA